EFADFNLVEGTSLALQIGHGNSVDIDLFGQTEYNNDLFIKQLEHYKNFKILKQSENILITVINDIKVDFVNYHYPLLKIDQLRLVSKQDIAAMKLNAIAGRGSKKDFIDLFFLLSDFSLKEIIKFYEQKYKNGSIFMVMKSLTYFDDAEMEEEPKMFVPFDWEGCKVKIKDEVNRYLKTS
ncbi:MAG: nucleotidyl transferase AbiEii/AbiGii toxin family protein, partial [Chitinophagales bacterium]|nr:nucleotidyl transferase AbiEii/AbiGii toxin family protein [Chitinophagales bacterium]